MDKKLFIFHVYVDCVAVVYRNSMRYAMNELKEKLNLLPENPGVYVMLDKDGIVIYVGKARVLKNRVRQYFHSSAKPEKVAAMVEHIADFYYIITQSEIDALALENNLIKKYKPKYNILLKDDKTYPYIKVHTKEEFPRVSITRKIKKDGKYFGPFMGGVRCGDILDIIGSVYNVRTCTTTIGANPKKPCLAYHLGRCLAPCAHICEKAEYAERIKAVLSFLDGNYESTEEILKEKMLRFAENEEFELAMEYREKLNMLSKLKLKRITSLNRALNADIIALRTNYIYSAVNVLVTRSGIMQGSTNFALEDGSFSEADALTAFIIQYYTNHEIPDEIITEDYCEKTLIEDYFKEKFDKKVEVILAKQGVKKQLLTMAQNNATDYLNKSIDKIKHKDDMTKNACLRLKEILGLKKYPKRMECYDISNISGVDKVGSMVVFIDGEADKSSYRRFKIKTVEGANDYASHQEMMRRRLSKFGTSEEERFPKPDLIIIDGGKGQLSAIKEVFNEMGIEDIELISLAEREEEIFTLFSEESIQIDHRDYALKMLQRIRDEAHRFAITYFRSLHSKRNLASVLQEIEGIGKKKRMALMDKFGTIDKIMSASIEELCQTEGIGEELAKKIYTYFKEQI
ncbi:MAG: excinuclease ABC subunit UvrC [Clostridiales bacterium]|nr:excinuclease ABC subunit UvrC [Clostridiales bacterium]